MADNLVIDEGSSAKSARTDEISANLHVPFVKVMDGTTDSTNAAIVDAGGSLQVDVVGALPAGTNSIGKLTDDQKIDINKIAGASVAVSGGTEDTALRVTIANNSTGVLSVDDNGSALTVDQATAANLNMTEASAASIKTAVELIDDAVYVDDADWTDSSSKHVLVGGLYQSTPQTITDGDVGPLQVDSAGKLLVGNPSIAGTAGSPNAGVLSVQGITSGTTLGVTEANSAAIKTAVETIDNAISGNEMQVDIVAGTAGTPAGSVVSVQGVTSMTALQVQAEGRYAHDGTSLSNPVNIGGKAYNAVPTAVANADLTQGMFDLYGRQMIGHIPLELSQAKAYNDTSSRAAGAAAVALASTTGKKLVITALEVSTYGTTGGRIILYGAQDATYTAGTDKPLFIASFVPSATVKPGAIISFPVPWVAAAADDDIYYQNDAAVSIDVIFHYYEV